MLTLYVNFDKIVFDGSYTSGFLSNNDKSSITLGAVDSEGNVIDRIGNITQKEGSYVDIFFSPQYGGNIEVYASIYDPEDPKSKLEAITTDKEWKVIETILETLQEEVRKKNQENNEKIAQKIPLGDTVNGVLACWHGTQNQFTSIFSNGEPRAIDNNAC